MLRCAQAHGPADPRWEVRNKNLRTLSVDLDGVPVSLDLVPLNGQPFDVDQIGGYENWYRIYCIAVRTLKVAQQAAGARGGASLLAPTTDIARHTISR
jgi:hypothetical protein